MATSRLDPVEEAWYHGRISRIEAEDFLKKERYGGWVISRT